MINLYNCLDYKFKLKKFLLFGCLICIFGCSLFTPELTRRYNKAECEDAPGKYVTVSAFIMDQPAAAKKDLPDSRGTSAMITAVAAKAKDFTELRSSLVALEIIPKKEEDIDKTIFKKRVVFAVDKEPFQPLPGDVPNRDFGLADRINNLTVNLAIINKGVRFASWDKFITADESVVLGTDQLTRGGTASLAASIGPVGPVAPATLNPSVSATTSLQEAVTLSQRRVKLSGKFLENGRQAVLRQEGAVGTDLTGTFIVDVDIKPDEGWRTAKPKMITGFSLPQKDSKGSDAAKLSLKITELRYLKCSKPIICNLKYDYILRHAKSDRIIAEGYQNVIFLKGTEPKNGNEEPIKLTLVKEDELKAKIYRIVDPKYPLLWLTINRFPDEKINKKLRKKAKEESSEGEETLQLGFSTITETNDFLDWLKEKDDNKTSFLKYEPFISPDGVRQTKVHREDIDNLMVQIQPLNY
ncbi:MAG: hypothetical protein WB948_12795 [Desulfobaccales bacterium]